MICALHKSHQPRNFTVEQHHVIPQAWQRFWHAAMPLDHDGLWDPRTVPLCPTGHRNVHALIVELMKQIAAQGNEDIPAAIKLAKARSTAQRTMALLALERFTDTGGRLLDLTAAEEWGEA